MSSFFSQTLVKCVDKAQTHLPCGVDNADNHKMPKGFDDSVDDLPVRQFFRSLDVVHFQAPTIDGILSVMWQSVQSAPIWQIFVADHLNPNELFDPEQYEKIICSTYLII